MTPDMFLTSHLNCIFSPAERRPDKSSSQSVDYGWDVELGLKQEDAGTERTTWVQKAAQVVTGRGSAVLNYLKENQDWILKRIGESAVGWASLGSGCREINKAFPSPSAKTTGAIFSVMGMGIVTIACLNAAYKHDWRTLLMKAVQLLGQTAAFVLTGDMDKNQDTQVAMSITLLACGSLLVTVAYVPDRFFAKKETDQNDDKSTQTTIPLRPWSPRSILVETARDQLSKNAITAFEPPLQESLKNR